jgi:ribonuclease HI
MKLNDYVIYTDGSCRGNKAGGIGVVWLKNGEKVYEYSKGFKDVTNNIMELTAIMVALKSIVKPVNSLTIVSDSEYALGCIFNEKWNPKKNVKLITKIKAEVKRVEELIGSKINIEHTYGHQKDDSEYTKWNNYVDKLAQNESKMIL